MNENAKISPKFIAIRFDVTEHWRDDIKAQVKRIWAHFIYDEHCVTNMCSLIPFYDLRWVGFDIELDSISDEISDELYQDIQDGFSSDGNDGYYPTGPLDKIDLAPERKQELDTGDELPSTNPGRSKPDLEYRAACEELHCELIEDYSANPIW